MQNSILQLIGFTKSTKKNWRQINKSGGWGLLLFCVMFSGNKNFIQNKREIYFAKNLMIKNANIQKQ